MHQTLLYINGGEGRRYVMDACMLSLMVFSNVDGDECTPYLYINIIIIDDTGHRNMHIALCIVVQHDGMMI